MISGQGSSLIPYLAAMGAGAGWQFTRPVGVYAAGEKGLILAALLLTIRIGLAVVIGWAVLIPYTIYLTVRAVRS